MSKLTVQAGNHYNKLLVIEIDSSKARQYWICKCDCGRTKSIYYRSLLVGLTKSCGCIQKEFASKNGKNNLKHGLWKHPLYNIFMCIKKRCNNPNNEAYESYGGRGIKCEFIDAEEFIRWAESNGYVKGLSVDRIDNNGNYSKENCRFVTMKVQQRNKRNNKLLMYKNELKPLSEWAEIKNINENTLYSRLRKGMSFEDAIEKAVIR